MAALYDKMGRRGPAFRSETRGQSVSALAAYLTFLGAVFYFVGWGAAAVGRAVARAVL